MYELVQVAEHTYYIECPAKIGVYEDTDGVYIIDSGNDKDAGRKIKKNIRAEKLEFKSNIKHTF